MTSFFKYLLVLIFLPVLCCAQGENNLWTFAADYNSNMVINFNLNTVGISTVPVATGFGYGGAVCNPNGQLRFILRLNDNLPGGIINNLFDPDGTAIAGSNLLTGMMTDGCMPVIVPRPGNPNQYYIIYSYSNGLLYTLLDMSLNNGLGGIVAGQKNVVFAPYGTVSADKMCAVPGCYGVWIVVHSRITNGYYSFHITGAGVDATAINSPVGNFQLIDYTQSAYIASHLKASPDGNHIVICAWKGLEMYDFEKCSGILKNARVIDTTGNLLPITQSLNNNHVFRDACFSPDGSKLYATFNQIDNFFHNGKLFQYDISLLTLPAIIGSKTLVMTNQPSYWGVPGCTPIIPNPLGELKLGPNGKLYIDNGSLTCLNPSNVPAGFNPGAAFHVIDQPNLSGLACQPQFNVIVVEGYDNSYHRTFFHSGIGGSGVPQNIVISPPPPDTIPGIVYNAVACFKDSLVLFGNDNGSCYHWDDNSTEKDRTVRQSGTYFVQYFKDCNYTTDTFKVAFIRVPVLSASQSCPGMHKGRIFATVGNMDTFPLNYIWRTSDSSILRQHYAVWGDTITSLDSGTYFVSVSSVYGCDTILPAVISNLAAPILFVSPTDTTIRYGDSLILNVTGALLYAWSPSGGLDSANKANPTAKPLKPVVYSVIGISENGCEDTGYVKVDIDYTMPDFVPNAFSPNGDGLNDIFRISGITYQKVASFRVFNRFGQEIFSTMDGLKGWDGNQNGKPCAVGTYYYFIQLDYPDGNRKTYKGDVTLIR